MKLTNSPTEYVRPFYGKPHSGLPVGRAAFGRADATVRDSLSSAKSRFSSPMGSLDERTPVITDRLTISSCILIVYLRTIELYRNRARVTKVNRLRSVSLGFVLASVSSFAISRD